MKKIAMSFVALSVTALLGSGCVSLDEYNRLQKQYETEKEANVAMSAEVSRQDGEISKLRSHAGAQEARIKELKDLLDAKPADTGEDLVKRIQEIWGGLGGNGDWEFVQSGGAVGVRMDDSGVLFKSGSWDLTDNTKKKLTELAGIIGKKVKSDANLFVRVDGHTDTDPVKKLAAKGIKDNVHLSTMRAMAVKDFLVSQGVPKDRVFVAGFGEYWPVTNGSTSKDKQRNRRVEVYLGDADALSIGALPGAQVSK
ncbi:MAG: OmpA family protein [Planctomycetes bacterium]|nr:OmpA family protein [Planctomycetota bacterium]